MIRIAAVANAASNNIVTIVLLSILIIILIYIAASLFRSYKKDEILSRLSPGIRGAQQLLKLEFGKNNVLTDINLPVYNGKKVESYIYADTIVLMKTGIAVCRLREEAGLIYCDDGFDWHQSARLRSGGTRETDFADPLGKNAASILALRKIFDKMQIEEPPIYGFVIFASRSVRFSCYHKEVMSLEDAYPVLKKLARGNKLQRGSQSTYRKMILTQTVRKSVADQYNVKKLK